MAAAYSPCAGSSPSAGGIFSGSLRDGVRVRVRVWPGAICSGSLRDGSVGREPKGTWYQSVDVCTVFAEPSNLILKLNLTITITITLLTLALTPTQP